MAFESGTAAVYPSAHVNTIQLSTEGSAPADCRMVARRTPVHSAVLIRFPPTSLLTHSRVTNSSTVASVWSSAWEYVGGVEPRHWSDGADRLASTVGSITFCVTT